MNAAVGDGKGIAEYDEFRAKMDEVRDACNFLPDVTTDEGYEKSKRVALDVGKLLTALENKRKELKAESLAFGRKVDAEAKSIATELIQFQLPHKEAYRELDNLRKQREADRKAALQERVDNMRNLPEAMRDASSNEVKAALEDLSAEECTDFYEFTEQALKARNNSKETLARLFAEKLNYEKEQAELARLRQAEAERAQRERDERIAREAKESAEREAKERIDQEREARESAEAQAKAAEEKAARDAREAAERAVEKERKEREAAEKAAAAAEEKRQTNKRHRAKINRAAAASLESAGITTEQAKDIVTAIAQGRIDHITINY